MWKPILAGSAALAIAGSSLVYAQQREHDGPGNRHRGASFSQEDRAAFTEARIAALKAGLRLTPDQEKNWPAFENALRDISKMHAEQRTAMQDRRESRSDDPVARLRRHAEAMTNAGATLKRLADAQEPLYQSLDDGQKNRFRLLARVLTAPRPHFAQMRGRDDRRGHPMMHGPRDGRGDRGDRGEHNMPQGGTNGSGQL